MNNFERVFVPVSSAVEMARMKFGEIFHVNKNTFAFICIHCSREYEKFGEFAVHVQEHLMSVVRQYSTVKHECDDYLRGECNQRLANELMQSETVGFENDDDVDVDNGDDFFDSFNNSYAVVSQPAGKDRKIKAFEGEVKINYSASLNERNGTSTTINSNYPRGMKWFMNPDEYRQLFEGTDYLVRDNKYICIQCETPIKNKYDLREHIATHRESTYYDCPLCPKKFKVMPHVQKHLKRTHKKTYTRTMIREVQTQSKKQIDTFISSRSDAFECFICKARFESVQALKEHVHCVHDGTDELQPNAGLKFTPHNNIKNRKCTICGKLYDSHYIKRHMECHSKDKNELCPQCGMAFSGRSQLKKHLIVHATKRHACNICGKTFKRIEQRTLHRRKHSERMPYHCTICNTGFMTPASLQCHVNARKCSPTNTVASIVPEWKENAT